MPSPVVDMAARLTTIIITIAIIITITITIIITIPFCPQRFG